ncbi:Ulp1-like peptidase [Cucumis melo var. makuwa]|uniref:Ulp1-like peptidase n=1 Tax=Cucumis melo var. makuwa TaxID=1194695 RepID=A0A5A7VFP3_CUCMM|nr:Ulp1-like peptidase [Cucumis melo var. makuwa]
MLRWVCQQSPKSQTISQVFDSPMFIIKAVIEMTPEEEQLKIASGELFENFCSSTIIQSKNGGSKRVREVVNDEDDFKKSKKQKSKTKMKKAIQNLQDRVADDEGDRKVSEGLVDHTLESKEVDNAKTEDVDTGGRRRCVGEKVDIGLEEPIDVVDDDDVTEIEPFLTQRPHVRPTRRKRASVYLSTPFTTLPKRSVTSTTCTSQSEPIVYDPMHKILDVHLDRFRAWIIDKRTDDEHLDALFLFIRLKIKVAGIPSSQNFTTADTIFMRILVAKWPLYKECIKENCPFDWNEVYRLIDYVVGSKEDFQDPWASVDYVYSPFNVHGNHWVLLCLDLVSCQVKV